MILRSGNLKMILVLLIGVIALYMQMIIVEIKVLGFKKLVKFVFSFASWGLVLDSFNTSLYNL